MKAITRLCYETLIKEKFVKTGIWSNGLFAYSKITLNENGEEEIKNENDNTYYQQRINGQLVMIHI